MSDIATYLIVISATFGISSMWLYSELFREIREYVCALCASEYYILRKLSYLGVCQLCCSFWIALVIQLWAYENNLVGHFLVSCGVAGISWLLGAMTRAFLFLSAMLEKQLEMDGNS